MRNIYFGFLVICMVGCAPITAEQLRAKPGGVYSFTVAGKVQDAYQKIFFRAQSCSESGDFGNNAATQGDIISDTKRSTITITNSQTVGVNTLFIIDLTQLDNETTEIKIYYPLRRYEPTARLIEEWIKNNAPECTRGKFIVECAC